MSISEQLFEAVKHGDSAHQAWLKAAIEAFFQGKEIPPIVLKGNENE